MSVLSRLLFGADFADYPIMQEALLGLGGDIEVLIGGRSGLAATPNVPSDSDSVYFDWQPYQRSCDIPKAGGNHRVVDAEAEVLYDEARRQFSRALDRVFLKPLTARDTERYFWDLVAGLEAWTAPRAERLIVWFAHTPHFPWHIVFFHVCRHFGVPFVIFKRTQTPDGMFFDADLMCGRAPLRAAVAPVAPDELLAGLTRVSGRLERSREINRRAEHEARRPVGLRLRWRLLRRFFRNRRDYRTRHYFRHPWWRLFFYAMLRDRERRADLAYLDAHARQKAPDTPYVYFALHYQPERTTVPEAGFYHDQIRAITALARALPEGWTLAVKEHPRQLGDRRPDLRCLHYSRQTLYRAIEMLDNAVLVDAFAPSDGLIAGARLTASCNGSSVFEGLGQGIPGLTFVPTWHSACRSAPAVEHIDALPALIEQLAAKTADTVVADFEAFVHDCSRYWFVGANDDRAAELSIRDRDTLISSMRIEMTAVVTVLSR